MTAETEIPPQLQQAAKVSTADIAAILGRDVDTVNHHINTLLKQKRLTRKPRPGRWPLTEAKIIMDHCSKNTRSKSNTE